MISKCTQGNCDQGITHVLFLHGEEKSYCFDHGNAMVSVLDGHSVMQIVKAPDDEERAAILAERIEQARAEAERLERIAAAEAAEAEAERLLVEAEEKAEAERVAAEHIEKERLAAAHAEDVTEPEPTGEVSSPESSGGHEAAEAGEDESGEDEAEESGETD